MVALVMKALILLLTVFLVGCTLAPELSEKERWDQCGELYIKNLKKTGLKDNGNALSYIGNATAFEIVDHCGYDFSVHDLTPEMITALDGCRSDPVFENQGQIVERWFATYPDNGELVNKAKIECKRIYDANRK
ncbi:hypothetical protein [Chromatium okenii]|jgi:hypothetical protein|uniref:Uncharacterized protein n=1 Tax=Chromatium okenii TaxID=61644 RepID=A0A2S7XLZ2_9GAMM|nr:hypothetical protein [Chromatium okenii]MBV5311385.1 hypothetical protein [Chromatium okenii]PQJ94759.1 hypothetical protein CXB77_18480 [Chromatium okenii]